MLNWLILLAVSKKLYNNFFSFKGDSVWSPTLVDHNKSTTGEGTYTALSIYGVTFNHWRSGGT